MIGYTNELGLDLCTDEKVIKGGQIVIYHHFLTQRRDASPVNQIHRKRRGVTKKQKHTHVCPSQEPASCLEPGDGRRNRHSDVRG
jgi:hypothetical protein